MNKIKLFFIFLSFIFTSLILFFQSSFAQTASRIVQVQPAKSEAAIYQKPDFDSKIIFVLPKGQKAIATRSTVEGLGGIGLFHKIKLSDKVYGYVLDTEIEILGKAKPVKKKSNESLLKDLSPPKSEQGQDNTNPPDPTDLKPIKPKSSQRQDQLYYGSTPRTKKPQRREGPLVFDRLIGGQIGFVNYTRDIGGSEKDSLEWVLGFKISGPNLIFRNLLMDISVSLHPGAPGFFDDFAQKSSGFFLISDITFPFILSRSKATTMYAGIGPLVSAGFFEFELNSNQESSKSIRFGAVGTLGFIYDLGPWALKVEPKYYFESSNYWAVLAGLQKSF